MGFLYSQVHSPALADPLHQRHAKLVPRRSHEQRNPGIRLEPRLRSTLSGVSSASGFVPVSRNRRSRTEQFNRKLAKNVGNKNHPVFENRRRRLRFRKTQIELEILIFCCRVSSPRLLECQSTTPNHRAKLGGTIEKKLIPLKFYPTMCQVIKVLRVFEIFVPLCLFKPPQAKELMLLFYFYLSALLTSNNRRMVGSQPFPKHLILKDK